MKPAVARWLEFAEIDLKAAKTLLEEGSLSSVVCFHAKQSVEKCLKALIESRGIVGKQQHGCSLDCLCRKRRESLRSERATYN